jgi:hypothetical protein
MTRRCRQTGSTTTQSDIWLLDLSGPAKAEPWLTTRFQEGGADFSPDGRWIAYESDGSGRFEVSIRLVRRQGGKLMVSTEGGNKPRWSRDGKHLYYINDAKLMAVSVAPQGETLAIGAPSVRARHDYSAARHRTTQSLRTAACSWSVGNGWLLLPIGLIVVQDWLAQVTRGSRP